MTNTEDELTIGSLIEVLKSLDPKGLVGIKAACCGHVHSVRFVHTDDSNERELSFGREDYTIVLQST
jgi:hypothetical protein